MTHTKTLCAALLLAGLLPDSAMAEDYKISHSVDISAPADEIWNMIGDFCDLDDWHPRPR